MCVCAHECKQARAFVWMCVCMYAMYVYMCFDCLSEQLHRKDMQVVTILKRSIEQHENIMEMAYNTKYESVWVLCKYK